MQEQTKRLLTVEETASYLNISPKTLYDRISPKARRPFPVKAKRIGRSVRFDVRDLNQFIDEL